MGCVYEITFPDDSRYVGMTKNPLAWRLAQHRYDSKALKHASSSKVSEFGLTPEMVTVHIETDDEEIRALLEEELIARRRTADLVVLNNANGGFTAKGFRHSQKSKQGMSLAKKGMYAGEKNRLSKLTDAQVKSIFIELHAGALKADIQKKYGVSSGYITDLCTGHKWKHIERPEGFDRKGKDRLVTDEQVKDIRKRVLNGEKQNALGNEYGISKATVSAIVHRRLYKNLKD